MKLRECSILHAQVLGFGRLAREMEPVALAQFLNKFFAAVIPPVEKQGGAVTFFGGDAFVAHFGAAKTQKDHAKRAVTAAVALQKAAAAFRAKLGKPVFLSLGVNSGSAAFGTLGYGRGARPAVLGVTVRIAGMLADVRQADKVLIGRGTHDRVRHDFAVRSQSPLSHPNLTVEVFEVTD